MIVQPVTRHISAGGARIYCIPLRAFPDLIAQVYVVIADGYAALIDTGSGTETSNTDLQVGFASLQTVWGEQLQWSDLNRIVITHGHIDHYGGLGLVHSLVSAPVAVHQLALAPVLDHHAWTALQYQAIARFLLWAGESQATVDEVLHFFANTALQFDGCDVATVLNDGDLLDGRLNVIHAPGHSAGQVCLLLDDVLFTADHILARTNPRLTPEHLEPHNGLDTYLRALERIAALPGIRLGLAGHETFMTDVYGRIATIRNSHVGRLDQLLAMFAKPQTIAQVSLIMYPQMRSSFERLLTTQMVAARVEYLAHRGTLTPVGVAVTDEVFASQFVRV